MSRFATEFAAELATANVALATGVVLLATALVTALVTFRTRKEVRQVHVLVNDRMTMAVDRIAQLTAALAAAGIIIPPAPDPTDQTGPH